MAMDVMAENRHGRWRNTGTRICVLGALRRSLQEDGSLSIGFTDRAFTFSGLESTRNREQVNLSSQHNRKALLHPHFMLHPPTYFHLQNQEKKGIVAGLVKQAGVAGLTSSRNTTFFAPVYRPD